MTLLLARVDVLGDGETGRKNVLEPQQLAACVLAGFEEDHPLPGEGVVYNVSLASHGASPCLRLSDRRSDHPRCGGHSHSETCSGCIVSRTAPTSSLLKASRSVSSLSLAEKASRVFAASYLRL